MKRTTKNSGSIFIFMGEVTQYARQAYLGTGPKGLLRATKGSKLPHPYRGITLASGTMMVSIGFVSFVAFLHPVETRHNQTQELNR